MLTVNPLAPRRHPGHPMAWLLTMVLWLGFATATPAYGPFFAPATTALHIGDVVILNRAVTAAGGARLYLQHGEVTRRSELRHREPYCYFFLYRDTAVIDTPFQLSADRFEITALWNGVEYGARGLPPIRYAGFPMNTQEASAENMVTRIRLESTTQPQVSSLKCGIFAVPNERNHLSLGEIREALGDVVTLRLQSE